MKNKLKVFFQKIKTIHLFFVGKRSFNVTYKSITCGYVGKIVCCGDSTNRVRQNFQKNFKNFIVLEMSNTLTHRVEGIKHIKL